MIHNYAINFAFEYFLFNSSVHLYSSIIFKHLNDVCIYIRDLNLDLPGGRWRQSLGEAGLHQVFLKKGSDKIIPVLSNVFIFILRRGSSCGPQVSDP